MFSAFFVESAPVPPIPNEQQLARLTDYVAFLENWKLITHSWHAIYFEIHLHFVYFVQCCSVCTTVEHNFTFYHIDFIGASLSN